MPAFTESSQNVSSFFTDPIVCRAILRSHERKQSRRPARPLDGLGAVEARHPALAADLPECATDPLRGLRAGQAPRDGLRDDHRPRHDRRRAVDRAPAGHVHLRGADRVVQGRAAGRARALLRHHARTTTTGSRPTATTSRRAPRTCTTHEITARARPPLLRRRGAADGAPPAAPGAAVPDLGDAQRLARQGAQPAGVRVHRDPRGHRHRGVRRPRRNRYRPDVHRDARAPPPRRSSWPTSAPDAQTRTAQQGSAAKWTHAAMALAIRSLGRRRRRPRARRPARRVS